MKIVILGAGSLGSVIGGMLAKGGSEVTLINHRREHVEQIRANGLRMTDEKTEWTVPVKARENPENIGQADLVIVLVKAYATASALREAVDAGVIGPNTLVMSMQNGLGNEETIAELLGPENVISGKTYVGGRMLAPGYVSAGYVGKWTYIGEMTGEVTDRIRKIRDEFNRADLLCEVSDNIRGMIWDKLLINVAAGALCGITGLPYGPLYEEDYIKDTAVAAVQEAIDVAKAAGVRLTHEDPEFPWYKASEGLPATFKTSILQSLESGRRTEIDYINGAVVTFGKKYGIATPVNQTLVTCIRGIEKYRFDYLPKL